MKLATVLYKSEERVGMVEGPVIRLFPREAGDMVDLARNGIPACGAEPTPLSDVRVLAPIRRFRRDVLCTGWNYWDHFEEGIGKRDGQEVERPSAPTFFTKAPDAIIDPEDDIAYDPRISAKWDYEAEIAVIIGKTGRSIPTRRAPDHIFGYTLANDISQRDLQRRHGGQWLKGKSIDTSTPLGPFIVTPDEIDLPDVELTSYVNGELRQNAQARQMAFTVAQIIAELSFGMTLHAGDVILTGTPSGIGMARNPPVWLSEDDEVVVCGSGLGKLRNRVVRADLASESDVEI
ncbi:fumarylacetoacetate hydrolase family protein [Aquamicrobium defluvii]|uniref:5-carboxymethyl-2-hydroxymuconate isomerase n=1 Tax=Aquamicrobium defluvii TaxID=69279 RepID=A0A011SWI4_9HYPH|nr:fumarylacetoacetate hydrolase family protein [Aquamicrobium defluvii]EXL03619.1 5-carboxymethyl-2-hydroxymuconate isomerase [Aquamicrobium defluvii]EZQ15270.1 5-carboxymethyl-2-hydroxymuconate isomerase [Halopseudomonas bauzanensis]